MKYYNKKFKTFIICYTGLFLTATIIPYMLGLVSPGIIYIGISIQQLFFAYNAYKLKQNGNLIFNLCSAVFFIFFSVYVFLTGRGY
ncbi:hypothetical protein [Cellulosilyticum sp. I15G10I2]|uniref:hypothetical protein n=1 Tax=Cellulosilyticum sp. I15G10I2 TaxID=1892843 RepID=UPI00085CA2DC|nr:hypothetical protein [Cellulosilyticum sp. I15G10I2]